MWKRYCVVFIWILLTVCYVWLMKDTGRSTGWKTDKALQTYTDTAISDYDKKLNDTKDSPMVGSFEYAMFYKQETNFERTYLEISIMNIMYLISTILCYHLVFVKKLK